MSLPRFTAPRLGHFLFLTIPLLTADRVTLFSVRLHLFEHRVFVQMLCQRLLKLQPGQLQQLNRLLQLRRHDQFLTQPKVKPQLHAVPCVGCPLRQSLKCSPR